MILGALGVDTESIDVQSLDQFPGSGCDAASPSADNQRAAGGG